MAAPSEVFVHLLPSRIPPGTLQGGLAVVIDVLRATTSMIHALASGAESVRPFREIDEALQLAATFPPGRAILGGERLGLPIEGFDFGNSPSSYNERSCRGKTLIMTTTNGTRAILASLDAERVFIAAFPNCAATLAAIREDARPVHLVCSGTDGRISLEDSTLAGSLASSLLAQGYRSGNDEAEIVAGLWTDVKAGGESLADRLSRGRGGRRVRSIGLAADLEAAATVDRFPIVAELERDPLRILSSP
jgi:2-phosphosulfolactate phosphatase